MKKTTLGLLGLLWIAPLLWLVITSLKLEKDVVVDRLVLFTAAPTVVNYVKAFVHTKLAYWLFNSVFVSTVSTVLVLALDSAIAFALSRIQFRGRRALFIFVLAGMMIPFEAIVIQLYLLFNALGLINTLSAMIIPRLAMPTGVFILTQFFKGIPVALEEAAYIDGAGRWTIFRKIILPLGQSALVTVMILSFINSWNDFLWPLIAASETMKYTVTVGIANFQGTHGTEYSLVMAGAVIASAPQILMFLLFRNHIVKGIALTGIKG
ncbi:MAG: ABC transporter permease [Spirochaetes bacterium RIFOXYC1_FULL_54_7]|nr:MAG: ABC transporter permease [Spirochaetes bacterium RIFOXYC1_FULL_54_7]